MIDFWEALGRLAYDKELFSEFKNILVSELEEALPPAGEIPWVNVTGTNIVATCLDIPGRVYTAVQRFLGPILTEQFVSQFVAGELIWTFRYQETRDAFDRMHDVIWQTKIQIHSPATSYFIALGLLIVDPGFRAEVANSRDCGVHSLPRLSTKQREHIITLVKDERMERELATVERLSWDEGCFDRRHKHPYKHPLAVDGKKHAASSDVVYPVI